MIFAPALARKVLDGEKTVTRRACSENPASPWFSERCGLGRVAAVQIGRGKPTIGRIRILSVRREALGHLDDGEAAREGFASAKRFEAAFAELNGGEYDPTMLVWRVEFELA